MDKLHCASCGQPTIDDTYEGITDEETYCDLCYQELFELDMPHSESIERKV